MATCALGLARRVVFGQLQRLHRAPIRNGSSSGCRGLLTLAIESSCDDTSVAILETLEHAHSNGHAKPNAILHFHEKVTSDNSQYRGIHPLVAVESHQENLALLVDKALDFFPGINPTGQSSHPPIQFLRHGKVFNKRRPDFISVTRGPGMRSSLQTGLDMAKGLAVAWQIPFLGVHHMQAHALTPRLVCALNSSHITCENGGAQVPLQPDFPFLSVLISGGHTLIILSVSLTNHRILASTSDVAIGDCLDKVARAVLPQRIIQQTTTTMYGALLENFTFPDGKVDYAYMPPYSLKEEHTRRPSAWGWALKPPFADSPRQLKARSLELSFGGLATAVERIAKLRCDRNGKVGPAERQPDELGEDERRHLAHEAMRVSFEHLVGRVILALEYVKAEDPVLAGRIGTVVVSGGVAANGFLRHVFAEMLLARGFLNLKTIFPPTAYCTDNAAMIAWAGMEMFQHNFGHTTPFTARAIRKWPLDRLLDPPIDR